jgi:transcriptional regulator with XRE-family HTH domain
MSVSARIRTLRRQKGFTIEALAQKIGIHKGHLSRIERGEKSPSLATLEAIAHSLGASMAQLFGEKADASDVTVFRRSARNKTGDNAYKIEAILTGSSRAPLAVYVVSPGPEYLEHDVSDHRGQEFLYVLAGVIDVSVADQELILATGDCALYDAALNHKLRRKGRANAQVLVVLLGQT